MDTQNLPQPTFRILGPIEIYFEQHPVNVPPGRQQTILACLLVEPNRVVSVDEMVNAIWDDMPPHTARTQVLICISKLRRSFSESGTKCPIITRSPGYLIRLANGQSDYRLFEEKFAKSAVLARDGWLDDAAALLDDALALWRGPALEGAGFSRDLRARATRLNARRLTAFEIWVDLKIRLGQHHDVVDKAKWLVDQYPMHENLRGQLMLALYRSGRRAEALDVYREGRHLLADELGLDPSEELQALQNAILVGDPSLRANVGVGITPAVSVRRHERGA